MSIKIEKARVISAAPEKPCPCTLCEMSPEEVLKEAHDMADFIAEVQACDPHYQDLEDDLEELRQENKRLEERVSELEDEVGDLVDEIMDLKEDLEE